MIQETKIKDYCFRYIMQYLFNNESDSEAFNNFKSQGTPRDHLTPSCSFGLQNQINWSLNDANVTAQVSPHFAKNKFSNPGEKSQKNTITCQKGQGARLARGDCEDQGEVDEVSQSGPDRRAATCVRRR